MEKTDIQFKIILKVKKLRMKNGFSQAMLASELGISNGQIGNIESAKKYHKYTLPQLYHICKIFNVSMEQLLLDDNDYNGSQNVVELIIKKLIDYGKK